MEGFANKNYVVDKVIRKRPLGNVYKARRVSDGVLCAIKELDVRHMSEEEKEDAMEEIRVLATVRNENVISYYDVFGGDNKLCVVMEYCDEPDLGRHIKTRAENQKIFSEAQVWSYLIQILRGLVAVHSRGLIHRDVRSGNIIQLDSSAVKIGDVRVGKVLKEGPASTTDIENPHCVPPEVWHNKAYTFKSDAWAVGCVLYEMITLAVPFGGCSLPDLRAKVILGQYRPIPTTFSTGLSNVVKLLLNPDQATRISARDMLLHPAVQAHLHHAPAPAPRLRVRASQVKNKLGSIPATTSISMELQSSYPTLVVPADKQRPHGQTLDSEKGVANPPENNRHQADLSSERPSAPSTCSRVAPILAPRAVLSSRDNDEMLADVNRPPNQAPKVKVPRVAMLSKAIPKSSSETSVTPSQSVPSTPRVNMKHFKTAYVQSPKVPDPDEFHCSFFPDDISEVSVSRKEKLENLVNSPGIQRSRAVGTPPTPRIVTPRREKSTESLRSAGSSRSDDSSLRIRAPIDTLDSRHTESATPTRENSLESARSVASSRSGDSVIRVRAPMDVSDVPQAGAVTQKEDSFRSGTSGSSNHSNGLIIPVRAVITDLDPAQLLPISDDLQTSLAGEDGSAHQAPELVILVDVPRTLQAGNDGATQQQAPELVHRVDGPEPPQKGNESAGIGPLPSENSRVSSFDSSTVTSRPSRITPETSQTKASVADGVARKTSAAQVSKGKAAGDALDKRLPPSRSRRLSFGGVTRTERPLTSDASKLATSKRESSLGTRPLTSETSKLATPKRESSLGARPLTSDPSKLATTKRDGASGTRPLTSHTPKLATPKRESALVTRKPAEVNGVASKGSTHSVIAVRTQGLGTDKSRVRRPSPAPRLPPSDGPKKASNNGALSDGPKKSSQNGDRPGVLPRRPLSINEKDTSDLRANSANPLKAVSNVAQTGGKFSAHPPTGTPGNQAKKQGANAMNGGVLRGHSPQKPVRSRRLSLDFPAKANSPNQ